MSVGVWSVLPTQDWVAVREKVRSAFTHWIDGDPYHTMLSVHIDPERRVRSDGQMIVGYPALYLLERHRLRRTRCGRICLARLVLKTVPTRELILRQRVEFVTLEFRVEERAIGLEIFGVR